MFKNLSLVTLFFLVSTAIAQENTNTNKFKQLKEEFATPNVYRNAAGAPGPNYYQQKADYKISVAIDDEKQIVSGEETITYTNNSPDPLTYLWLQLDQNVRKQGSDNQLASTGDIAVSYTHLTLPTICSV